VLELVVSSKALRACLWGLALFLSILVAGLRLYPALSGRVILGLIGAGFVLFTIARSTVPVEERMRSSCAPLLSPPMRAVYWAGYALMISGTVLTGIVSLSQFGG
jgi:hypothetical protein